MTTPNMAQSTTVQVNGVSVSPTPETVQAVAPGKRKRDIDDDRDDEDGPDEQKPAITNGEPKKDQRELIRSFIDVLTRYAIFFRDYGCTATFWSMRMALSLMKTNHPRQLRYYPVHHEAPPARSLRR